MSRFGTCFLEFSRKFLKPLSFNYYKVSLSINLLMPLLQCNFRFDINNNQVYNWHLIFDFMFKFMKYFLITLISTKFHRDNFVTISGKSVVTRVSIFFLSNICFFFPCCCCCNIKQHKNSIHTQVTIKSDIKKPYMCGI